MSKNNTIQPIQATVRIYKNANGLYSLNITKTNTF